MRKDMTEAENDKALFNYVLALGDDSLVLGQRLAEWCRNGPFLEEDLALSNVALDYIGRARLFYGYAAELEGKGRTEDDLAFLRDCREFRNFLITELPRGDFAFTMAAVPGCVSPGVPERVAPVFRQDTGGYCRQGRQGNALSFAPHPRLDPAPG